MRENAYTYLNILSSLFSALITFSVYLATNRAISSNLSLAPSKNCLHYLTFMSVFKKTQGYNVLTSLSVLLFHFRMFR